MLRALHRFEEAVLDCEKASTIDPKNLHALGEAANAAMRICDWQRRTKLTKDLIASEQAITDPLVFISYLTSRHCKPIARSDS